MKFLLLALLVAMNSSFAGVSEIQKLFNQEKKYGENGESQLESEILKTDKYFELGKILGEKIVDYTGLTSVKTTDLDSEGKEEFKKKAMNALIDGNYSAPFYCDFYEANWDWDQTKNCRKSVEKIVDAILNDENIENVYIVELAGDYYGDWALVSIIAIDNDKKEGIVLDFDIIHEI